MAERSCDGVAVSGEVPVFHFVRAQYAGQSFSHEGLFTNHDFHFLTFLLSGYYLLLMDYPIFGPFFDFPAPLAGFSPLRAFLVFPIFSESCGVFSMLSVGEGTVRAGGSPVGAMSYPLEVISSLTWSIGLRYRVAFPSEVNS